jgi:DNA-binding response OmpR family regulator
LVVAGDAQLRAAIVRILRPAGYAVELAGGEKRARELVAAGAIDAAIMAPSSLGACGPELASGVSQLI